MTYFDPGNGDHVVIDGMIVERDALRVVEALKEFDEYLEVICNTSTDEISEAPYIICERVPDGEGSWKLVRIFEAWQLDDRVLDRVKLADGRRFSLEQAYTNILGEQERKREARYRDTMGYNKEVVAAVVGTKQSTYTWKDELTGDIVKFHEDRPATRLTDVKTFQ